MDQIVPVSCSDGMLLLELVSDTIACSTVDKLKQLISKLNNLLDFDAAIFAVARITPTGGLGSHLIINISYPAEWLEYYLNNKLYQIDPITREHFLHYSTQFWKDTYKKYDCSRDFVSSAEEHGLKNGYTSSLKNHLGSESCLLSLAGVTSKSKRSEYILNVITPHYHQAYIRSLDGLIISTSVISAREKEILNWVKNGKSSWDISVIVGISERTVKFHLNNIFQKLNAVSRAHAVAIALSQGLIEVD